MPRKFWGAIAADEVRSRERCALFAERATRFRTVDRLRHALPSKDIWNSSRSLIRHATLGFSEAPDAEFHWYELNFYCLTGISFADRELQWHFQVFKG
jgi:hypothetical protein